MLDKVVADLVAQMAEEQKEALEKEKVVVVVVTSYFCTYIACYDVQSDDGVFQDIDEQEQEDGSRFIYT